MRLRDFAFVAHLDCKKKSVRGIEPATSGSAVRRSAHCANAAAVCRDDRRGVRCRCARPSSRACGRLRTNPLLDARRIVDNFRTPSQIFAIFFCSVSPTRRAPYCREFRASVPRRRRVRRRAASVDWPFCRLA
jgi:hypothetical protein